MFCTMDEMAELYKKITEGIYTEQDLETFNMNLETACLEEKFIVEEIKKRLNNPKK